MRIDRRFILNLLCAVALVIGLAPMARPALAEVSIVSLGTPYAQNFNSLASTGISNTWTDDTTLTGWYSTRTIYLASSGTSTTGGLYSFGTVAADRALGSIGSNTAGDIYYGARLKNNTGALVTSLAVSYTGEQWRNGGNTTQHRLDFAYQTGTTMTSLTAGTWTDVDALDFIGPIATATAGALDGNVAANRVALSSVVPVTISPGQEIMLRWKDANDAGNDHGLAIDDLSVVAFGVPVDVEPSVSSTNPTGGATDVLLTGNIDVTFSEPVNVSGNWFQLVCPSGTRNVADTVVTGGPTTFTINPNVDFANSETCTLTVFAAQVADQDSNDPPDNMAANYVTSFTTIGPDAAPDVASTVPADGATNVPLNQNITVNFTEPVNVTDPWFSLTCATSGTHAAAVSGGPASFTLNPTTDFVFGEACTLVIDASKVSDQDNNDPPNNMVFNFTAGFTTEPDPCTLPFTPIYQIQGIGPAAAITGTVTTEGVVVGDYEGASPTLRGFYFQDLTGDANAATSDGIFVFNGNNNNVSLGDVVRVTGTASEFQDQTQISSTSIRKCGTGSVAPVDVTFPVPSATYLEQYEGMLVRLPQTLYVTEHFQLGRFGQVVLSSGGRLKQPTNIVLPGAPALAMQDANNLNRIILDDALQNQNPDPILFGRGGNPLSASNTLRGGDTASNIIGIMTYTWAGNAASGNAYRVRPINALGGSVNFVAANPRPASAPAVGGELKVAGMNLLNFFNTFDGLPDTVDNCTNGVGGAATDCRGADTAAEFARQWPKTVAAIVGTGADVIGVNEIENDGYGPTSAIQFLVDQLNAATAPGTYAFIDVDTATGQVNALGTDAIKVGMIYKPAVVTPIGQTSALNSVAFVNGGDSVPRSRPSLAQAFEQNSDGARFIVDVNHLKSKGSACTVPDALDGQGNCNIVRVNAAIALMAWLATDPTGTGDPDVLLMGDYNSYAMEDPITVIRNAGFTNLIEAFLGPDAYSYVFDGQWGYLDHALGSASIVSQVSGVGDWHINSDEPSVLDYNTDFKTVNLQNTLYAPDQFRISDHDPVIVGLDLNAPPSVDAGGPYMVSEGGSVGVSAAGSDPDVGDILTYEWDLDNNGSFETAGQSVTFSAVGLDGPSSHTIKVRVTDNGNLTAVASATVTVNNVAPDVGPITAPLAPAPVNTIVNASASFTDPGVLDTHTAVWDWGDGNTSAGSVTETNGSGSVSGNHTYTAAGVYTVKVTVTDKDGGADYSEFQYVVVYDPNGGFVTGGGWINSPAGAYTPDPTLSGKANFGFVAKYKKGASVPDGNTQFQFHAGGLNFHSASYEWLVVAGSKAQFKGAGAINGEGAYKFLLWADDGTPDTFRIKIWYEDAAGEHVVYDNGTGQALDGGSIVVHK